MKYRNILLASVIGLGMAGAGEGTVHAEPADNAPSLFNVSSTSIERIFEVETNEVVRHDKPETYKVKEGDTLVKIAKKQDTSWKKLFYKNKDVKDPDKLKIGLVLELPKKGEKLKKRPIPPNVQTPVVEAENGSEGYAPRTSGGANTYAFGNCTWAVKNWRPEIPNTWGNADTWFSRATADGWATGFQPRVGAIATAVGYMHVALVIAVDGNRVKVREMNYSGFNVVSERWSDTSEWQYIY